jgi:thiamine transport system substrate-binding protein
MRHFLIFVAAVFTSLFVLVLNRHSNKGSEDKAIVRIYSYSSFTSPWGPGPVLKQMFEKDCNCRVEYAEGNDAGILLQRLKVEGETLGADLVIGFDQYDLNKALATLKWQPLNFGKLDLEEQVKPALTNNFFVPYDWGVLTFMTQKRDLPPKSLDDLLKSDFSRKIIIQDPRTSSPGFQFLNWVLESKGERNGFQFLKDLFPQLQTMTPSWSAAISLFNKTPDSLVFTYVTSPLYYELEEKKSNYVALDFVEPLPMQTEFLGIPEFCRQCELAANFVNLMLSPEGQRVLMQKNYMLPVLKDIRQGTPYEDVLKGRKIMAFEIPSEVETDRLIRAWSEIRRGQ